MKDERIESLAQILEEYGVVANDEQIANIVDDFSLHIEMEAEMGSYGHVDRSGKCDKCEQRLIEFMKWRRGELLSSETITEIANFMDESAEVCCNDIRLHEDSTDGMIWCKNCGKDIKQT